MGQWKKRIRLRIGCAFSYQVDEPSPALVQVAPLPGESVEVLEEAWELDPPADMDAFTDFYGNLTRRLVLPRGAVGLRYDALAQLPGRYDDVDETAPQRPVEEL